MLKSKSRNFTFLLYPESLPDDWQTKLLTMQIPMAISPLHDKDLSNVDGQKYKKPHYHVIYIANNPVTTDSVRVKLQALLGRESLALVKIVVSSLDSMYKYLTHESVDAIAKNKHKYDVNDIVLLNNFDIDRYITIDAEEKDEILNEILDIISDNGLQNILDLRDFVLNFGDEYNLNMKKVNQVIRAYSGIARMYFDGAYQRRKQIEATQDKNRQAELDKRLY